MTALTERILLTARVLVAQTLGVVLEHGLNRIWPGPEQGRTSPSTETRQP